MKSLTVKTLAVLVTLTAAGTAAHAQKRYADADLDCRMKFQLTGWSAIYKHAEGNGIVTCANGQTMRVRLEAKGGGLTVGKYHIDNGNAHFTDVHRIDEVLGGYAQGEAHAGIVKTGTAQVLTKGTVSLALAGAGEGVDLGIAVGELKITPAQ
ncbi:MAG TPA: hypothetical protein VF132_14260 [Rudaea sp.]